METHTQTAETDFRAISLLTAEQAHAFRVIPLEAEEKHVQFIGDESSLAHKNTLSMLLGKSVRIKLVESASVDRYLIQHYPRQTQPKKHQASSQLEDESDTVRFLNKCLTEAARMGASDIHFERYELSARVRFRWEGQLVEKYEIPLQQYNAIISRIKILSDLDISERRLPQDGRIHFRYQGTEIDVRVSTMPTKYGEKSVLRLLTRSENQLQLANLGLGEAANRHYQQAISKPNGIILITGPTGSGKTTTLYATLNQLNQPDKNLITIEDPIEYNLSGINQVQLKEEIGLTFDRTLRAILRQDPNIIMIGEIRDVATAQIAIRASLTGRLVFSTLHTNSSWDAITRMTDMGVEPYLLAASLRLVVAQRLLRVLCERCKCPSTALLFPEMQKARSISQHFIPQGCPHCYYTGYKGRKAVFEVLPVGRELGEYIKNQRCDIRDYMNEKGIGSLEDRLADLVKKGESSLEEAMMHWGE